MKSDRLKIRRDKLIKILKAEGIADKNVLDAMANVSREDFLPKNFQDQAYENIALPIGQGQTISQPSVVARMTQELQIPKRGTVLEIGTGSGYQTIILSQLARRIYTIERHSALLEGAEKIFTKLKIRNITAILGDGSKGWTKDFTFDRIMVTAAGTEKAPEKLLAQLKIGGIMLIPLGKTPQEQYIYRITRQEDGYLQEKLWAVRFVPLVSDS